MLLKVKSVVKRFGGLKALHDVDLTVEENSITALIGPNGAGKTTMFNSVTNLTPIDSGEIFFTGERIDHLSPHLIAGLGIQRTFQLHQVFTELTVLENVALGMHVSAKSGFLGTILHLPAMRREESKIMQQSLEAIHMVGLDDHVFTLAGQLPYGQQKMVEVARAMVSRPKLLLLDEPTNGLNPSERKSLTELVLKIRRQGTTVFFVAHDMATVMRISDKIHVLSFGQKIAEGPPREILKNKKVIEVYLGEEQDIA